MKTGIRQQTSGKSKKASQVFRITFCAVFVALCSPAQAQQPGKIARIGYLTATAASAELPRFDAFRQGLRALGHIEGQNISIEIRHSDTKFDRLSEFAAEFVRSKVDVLVVASTPAALAAKKATGTIPIVFVGVTDPVAAGLVESLARPGGNVTGFTNVAAVLSGKRLELLKETAPKISRVAVLWDPQVLGSVPQWQESQLPARELGLKLYSMEVSSADKYEDAFKLATKVGNAALAVTLNPIANSNQKQVVNLAAQHRMPAIYPRADYVESGGLISYGPIFAVEGQDAARHVAKILKGAKPAELPVEQPNKFELVINLKSAKEISLTIPPNVLARADRVIR